jgi:1-phosphatidylinositol-3-phosphate 5-kinase
MESPQVASPVQPSLVGPFARSRSDTKIADDVTSLTSFNPFSEEDENDQSSYTLVTSLFSRMKNLIDAPLSSAVSVASGATVSNPNAPPNGAVGEQRKPSGVALAAPPPTSSSRNVSERPQSLTVTLSKPAQPLVSLPHAVSEAPYLAGEHDRSPSRTGNYYDDGALFAATTIPGFPIQDDTRSIRTSASVTIKRSDSVSKVIRRIRGEGTPAFSFPVCST